ncbi:MAG: YqgE/AlgH family protein [Thermodesulfobacteriota bacterium]
MESLQGSFLVATNQMYDPRFMKCVILICVHNDDDGAMGLVVNQPLTDLSMADVFRNCNIKPPAMPAPPVLFGGPVDVESAFILHSADYKKEQSQKVADQIFLSRDPNLLFDLVDEKGPEHYLLTLGYAGWAPGQLEQELYGEGWLTLPAEANDIFLTSAESMWHTITSKNGIDINLYSDIPGNA